MRGIGLGMLGAVVFAVAAQGQVLIAGSIDGQHPVSADTVKKIEGTLVMPDGAAKVADYVRYYAPSELAGRKLIAGVYVLKSPPTANCRACPAAAATWSPPITTSACSASSRCRSWGATRATPAATPPGDGRRR